MNDITIVFCTLLLFLVGKETEFLDELSVFQSTEQNCSWAASFQDVPLILKNLKMFTVVIELAIVFILGHMNPALILIFLQDPLLILSWHFCSALRSAVFPSDSELKGRIHFLPCALHATMPWLRRIVSWLGPHSIPGQTMWDLWQTLYHWDRLFSEYFGSTPCHYHPTSAAYSCIHQSPRVYSLLNWQRRCITHTLDALGSKIYQEAYEILVESITSLF